MSQRLFDNCDALLITYTHTQSLQSILQSHPRVNNEPLHFHGLQGGFMVPSGSPSPFVCFHWETNEQRDKHEQQKEEEREREEEEEKDREGSLSKTLILS